MEEGCPVFAARGLPNALFLLLWLYEVASLVFIIFFLAATGFGVYQYRRPSLALPMTNMGENWHSDIGEQYQKSKVICKDALSHWYRINAKVGQKL